MKKILLASLLFVLLAPQALLAQSANEVVYGPTYLYPDRESCTSTVNLLLNNYWLEDGYEVWSGVASVFEFEMASEYGWPYSHSFTVFKNLGLLPMVAWKDDLPYVAILNSRDNEIRIYNLLYPQHSYYEWQFSGEPYVQIYDEALVVQSADDPTDWSVFDPYFEEIAQIIDFEDLDIDSAQTDYGFPFKPVVLTNGSLFFWDSRADWYDWNDELVMNDNEREVIWVNPAGNQAFPDYSVMNPDFFPEAQYFMLNNEDPSLPLTIYDQDQNTNTAAGLIGNGVYTYNLDTGKYARLGFGKSQYLDLAPRIFRNGFDQFVAWFNEDGNPFLARYDIDNMPDAGVSDIPSWDAFRLPGSNVVYKHEAYSINGESKYGLIKFCSARAYQLATQDDDFTYVTVLPNEVDFDRDVPCGGIPHYRPFKMESSSTVYYKGKIGLISYCSADDYFAEHHDRNFYWVVEFVDGEIEFEKPTECTVYYYDE